MESLLKKKLQKALKKAQRDRFQAENPDNYYYYQFLVEGLQKVCRKTQNNLSTPHTNNNDSSFQEKISSINRSLIQSTVFTPKLRFKQNNFSKRLQRATVQSSSKSNQFINQNVLKNEKQNRKPKKSTYKYKLCQVKTNNQERVQCNTKKKDINENIDLCKNKLQWKNRNNGNISLKSNDHSQQKVKLLQIQKSFAQKKPEDFQQTQNQFYLNAKKQVIKSFTYSHYPQKRPNSQNYRRNLESDILSMQKCKKNNNRRKIISGKKCPMMSQIKILSDPSFKGKNFSILSSQAYIDRSLLGINEKKFESILKCSDLTSSINLTNLNVIQCHKSISKQLKNGQNSASRNQGSNNRYHRLQMMYKKAKQHYQKSQRYKKQKQINKTQAQDKIINIQNKNLQTIPLKVGQLNEVQNKDKQIQDQKHKNSKNKFHNVKPILYQLQINKTKNQKPTQQLGLNINLINECPIKRPKQQKQSLHMLKKLSSLSRKQKNHHFKNAQLCLQKQNWSLLKSQQGDLNVDNTHLSTRKIPQIANQHHKGSKMYYKSNKNI